jgi:hypothetical protein
MRITDKLTLSEYDKFCSEKLTEKNPSWFSKDWLKRMGDCIYDYSKSDEPTIRKGVHNELNVKRDLSGYNALLSTEFYYFGEEPRVIPQNLKRILKKNQGHLRIEDLKILADFENWINKFEKNKVYAEPQLGFEFKLEPSEEQINKCSKRHHETEKDEIEETIC